MITVILGRLGKDAEVSVTSGGTQCVKFSLAENVYKNGKEETIWYEVTSYDPFVAKSQSKVLKKGAFAVVVGDVDSKINVAKNGNIYLNQYITASSIKVPNIGNGNNSTPITKVNESSDNGIEMQQPTMTMPVNEEKPKQIKKEIKTEPIIQPSEIMEDSDDDLPF